MSQFLKKLEPVLRYGFWIGSVIVVLASLGIWYMSTDKLVAEYGSRSSKIKSDVQTVSTIRGKLSEHPNDLSHKKMEDLIVSRRDEVLKSWQLLYERQIPILTWPHGNFTEDFLTAFENKMPFENSYEFSETNPDTLEQTLRGQYKTYIKNVLPSVAKIAGAEWTASFESAVGAEGMSMAYGAQPSMGPVPLPTAARIKEGPLVVWSDGSQASVLADLFPWRGRSQPPSTLEIYYSQENIWILKQLLGIIKEVNGPATQRYQTKIREIKRLSIGRSVSFKSGNVDIPGLAAMMGGMGMGGSEMDRSAMMGMEGSMSMEMSGMMGESLTKTDPADNRYVDVTKKPITASALRSALSGDQPADVALAIAKRVPVMMSLKIDQRAIPQLLAVCGSVPLMVEVHQVRVLPPDASSGSDAMGMGMSGMGGGMGMGGPEMGGRESMGGMESMGGGMGGMSTPAPAKPENEYPFDLTCEVYGLISIYNPPDARKLGLEAVDKDTELSQGPEIVKSDKPQPAAPATVDPNAELPIPPVAEANGPALGQVPGALGANEIATNPDPAAPAENAAAMPPAAVPVAPAAIDIPAAPGAAPPAGVPVAPAAEPEPSPTPPLAAAN
jgi:hypothetical protein